MNQSVSLFRTIAIVGALLSAPLAFAQTNFFIEHKPTNLRFHSCSNVDGTPVIAISGNNSSDCAQWRRVPVDDYFYIQNARTGMNIRPATRENGAAIEVRPQSWRGNFTQWSYDDRGEGFGHLVNRATGKHIFIAAGGLGAPLEQRPSSWRGNFTRWRFVEVGSDGEPLPTPSSAPTPSTTPTSSASPISTPAPTNAPTQVPTAVPTSDPTQAPTTAPTAPPVPSAITLEAETGVLSGNARTFSDAAASGGQGVAFIFALGDSLGFTNVVAADSISVRYASEFSGTLSVRVNSVDVGNFNFSSTGQFVSSYAETSLQANIPENATVEIFYDNGDSAMNIDTVTFSSNGGIPNPGPQPTPASTSTPAAGPTPGPIGDRPAAGKPAIPAEGQRYFILGQDQISIEEYMSDPTLPRPVGFTTYTTLSRGEPNFDNSYCFKGLDGLKNIGNYRSNTSVGCAPNDNRRQNFWGSGTQNAEWVIETYNPEIVAIGMFCPRNDLISSLFNNGAYDDLLEELADFFNQYSSTSFFLRTCYEFNGDAGGWSPENIRGTFRYVREFLDSRNVTNVAHVWQSDSFHSTQRSTGPIGEQEQGFWPGRRFVDWVGSSQFASLVDEEAAIAESEGLPHFIAEATVHGPLFFQYDFKLPFNTSTRSPSGIVNLQNDLIWFNDKRGEIDRASTKAWHYINANWSIQPQWANAPDQAGQNFFTYTDSRIQVSPEVRQFFINYVTEQNGFILGE